ncbi:MAG TPA: hypothetical protein VJN63_08165 [Thermoplasmata archaeon]|nr:hypothetical protein [Thermoplasmata archaeon]
MAERAEVYGRFAMHYDLVYENLVDYDADVRYLEAGVSSIPPKTTANNP